MVLKTMCSGGQEILKVIRGVVNLRKTTSKTACYTFDVYVVLCYCVDEYILDSKYIISWF